MAFPRNGLDRVIWNRKSLIPNDPAHKHAVTQVGSLYYCYDANGNLTKRNAASASCTAGDALSYDLENRLTFTTVAGVTTNYAYNGDGARVKKVANGVTTYYVGNLYEYTTWTGGSSVSKYYYFGSQRVAVKQDINISYIHGDHLGSTSKTTGASASTQTYYPYGAIKTSSGTPPTDYGYTGQKRDASANLMYYGARYYDPALARFIQPDTIVPNPGNPQTLNRYTYVNNNPLKYTDPSGHCPEDGAPVTGDYWEDLWYTSRGYYDCDGIWAKGHQPGVVVDDPDVAAQVLKGGDELAIVYIKSTLQIAISNGKNNVVISGQIAAAIVYTQIGEVEKARKVIGEVVRQVLALSSPSLMTTLYVANPDAFGIGVGISAGAIEELQAVVGVELIYNFNSSELSVFAYGATTPNIIGARPGLAGSVYGILVWNLERNADYAGPFYVLGGTGAYGLTGLTVSAFTGWNPQGQTSIWDATYGFTFGWAYGVSLGISGAEVGYCGVYTVWEESPVNSCTSLLQ